MFIKKICSVLLLIITAQMNAQFPGCTGSNDVAGNTGQPGLYGEYVAGYFSDNPSYFGSTIAATNRIEADLNYTGNNWGAIVPPASNSVADPDSYSARYRGSIYIATAGIYTFYLTSDDASFLWIDNDAIAYPTVVPNALINNGGLHGDVTISANVSLTVGFHNIQIQFGEQAGGNHLIFEYSSTSPSITRQVVPGSILCTGIQPAIPAIVVTPPPGCSCNAGVTSELYTNYFNDVQTFFTSNTAVINRQDSRVSYTSNGSWGNVCPPLAGSNANPETFSARFTGQIYIATAGMYTFYLTSDDGSYLWLDANALVTNPTTATALINNGNTHSANTISATVSLSVGLHDFKIHYGDNTGDNICYLEYQSTSAGISRQVIPQAAFCSCLSTFSTLPVELIDFTAKRLSDQQVMVNWSTASEQRSKQFNVERSANGSDFTSIATVLAQAKTGSSIKEYQYLDNTSLGGISYYRLRQIDLDETFTLYPTVAVESDPGRKFKCQVFPNPNDGRFSIVLQGLTEMNRTEIRIYAMDGQQVYQNTPGKELLVGNTLTLNPDLHLRPGLYVVNCSMDGYHVSIKINVNEYGDH